jgi:hypothetical protein
MLSSRDFFELYVKQDRDVHVYELKNALGIQLIRRYESHEHRLNKQLMFIRLSVEGDKPLSPIIGGVDMVAAESMDGGWVIQHDDGRVYRRPTNFFFNDAENVYFDRSKRKFIFQKTEYSLNEFVDLLEKNHMRDMFFFSRLKGSLYSLFLFIVFFLADQKYNRLNVLIPGKSQVDNISSVPISDADPVFHYFKIYKNFLGIVSLILLPILFNISANSDWYSASNPFWIVLAVCSLYVLDILSRCLQSFLSKNAVITRLAMSSIENKGRLKKL